MYSRLQNRLNPVPESLNSPDIAPPASNDGMVRPPRDDPLRVYNRDIRVSISVLNAMLNLWKTLKRLTLRNWFTDTFDFIS